MGRKSRYSVKMRLKPSLNPMIKLLRAVNSNSLVKALKDKSPWMTLYTA